MDIIKMDNGCKIFSYCPDIEESALEQMQALTSLTFVKHAALMPDAHMGMMMPIGGVIACDNVIIPTAVGVDIGCGMGAIKTSLTKDQLEDMSLRRKLLNALKKEIPVGFTHNSPVRMDKIRTEYLDKRDYELNISCDREFFPLFDKKDKPSEINSWDLNSKFFDATLSQLGTLGGGNHFLEFQHDEDGAVWVMVHSGSRNIGKRVCDFFDNLAKTLNKKWHSETIEGLSYFPADSREGQEYLKWMQASLDFAYLNRRVMLECTKGVIREEFPDVEFITDSVVNDAENGIINIHHNFASLENHFGKNYWIHRKGATWAKEGMTGLIPGSMGTNSYVVKGLGNPRSMMSCSHGAGRKMGRRAFNRMMADQLHEVEESLKGIVYPRWGKIGFGKDKGLLDVSESPMAYKDIDTVMSNQLDLVTPVVKLYPMMCLKG